MTADAAPIPEMPIIDAAPVVVVDAPPPKPVLVAVDPQTLPVWDTPPGIGKGPTISVFAVDMGSRLLAQVYQEPIVMAAVTKRITGRITAPRDLAAIAIAKQLGIELTPLKLDGKGATVDFDFTAAPGADLLRVLADTGRVNIVAPGAMPELDVRVKRKPWDGTVEAIARVSGRTVTRNGNTYYLLPTGTALPPLPKAPAITIDIDVKDGTLAQATAALARLTPMPISGCDGTPFTIRLKRAPLAEALRAMALLGGGTLTAGATCPASALTAASDDLRLVAIAGIGTKRAAAFDRKGTTLTAVRDGTLVKDMGENYVVFDGDNAIELHTKVMPIGPEGPPPDHYLARFKRTAALIQAGDQWTALLENTSGWFQLINPRFPEEPITKASIEKDGVHLEVDGQTAVFPLGRLQ